MKKKWSASLGSVGIALLWAIPAALFVARFPTVYIDEAENANHAYNFAFHHLAVFSLYDGLYPPSLSFLRRSWPVVIRPFFVVPLGLYFRAVGFSFIKARLWDVLLGMTALGFFHAICRRAFGRRMALLASALLGTRFAFLYSTHTIRPETMLCLAGIIMIGCLLKGLENESGVWFLAAGFIAGAAGGIHTNGVWFVVPCVAMPLLERRWRVSVITVAGCLLGVCAFMHFADWDRFLPGVQTLFFREFAAPPLETLHGNVPAAIADEFERYQGGWIFSQWRGGLFFQALAGWQLLVYTTALCWAFTQPQPIRRWAWAGSLFALAYALGVGQKAYNYTTALEPFFILPLAFWLTQKRINAGWTFCGAALAMAALPFGQLPLVIVPAFFLLKRRAAQTALLTLLLCLFSRISILKSALSSAEILCRSAWPVMIIGFILLGIGAGRLYRRRIPFSADSFIAGLMIAVTAGTLIFVADVWRTTPTFLTLSNELSTAITPGARVVGPQEFWLGLSDFDYRDIGGLMWYRLLLGQKDLLTPLAAFHPRYMIVDSTFLSRLRRFNADRHVQGLQPPSGLFTWPHHIVRIWSVGPAYGDQLALIENDWAARPLHDKK